MTDDKTQNVVPLHPQTKAGDTAFMRCACQPEGVDFLVLAINDPGAPIVAALVCPECERELSVVNGVVSTPEQNGPAG